LHVRSRLRDFLEDCYAPARAPPYAGGGQIGAYGTL
jgi:hypothetical protein